MVAIKEKLSPPSDDKRWKVVETTIRRNGGEGHALIEVLHSVQEWFGCLDDKSLQYVAQRLELPLSKVYGVATFYHFFTLKPKGKHTCVVCNGTACYIKGASQLMKDVQEKFGIASGETTADNELSLLTARCLGSCGLAPAVVIDGDVAGNIKPADLIDRLERLVRHDG